MLLFNLLKKGALPDKHDTSPVFKRFFLLCEINQRLTLPAQLVKIIYMFCRGGLAQLARVPDWQSGGHEFESRILHHSNQIRTHSLLEMRSDLWFAALKYTHGYVRTVNPSPLLNMYFLNIFLLTFCELYLTLALFITRITTSAFSFLLSSMFLNIVC